MDDAPAGRWIDDICRVLLEGRDRIYMDLGEYPDFDASVCFACGGDPQV
jgi:hypothetical protein